MNIFSVQGVSPTSASPAFLEVSFLAQPADGLQHEHVLDKEEEPMNTNKPPAPARAQSPGNKPVHSFRIGVVKAAIWENHSGDNTWYGVTVSRSYKDGDQWKNSDSFGRDDLLALSKVADQAHTWICERQAGA